MKSIFVLVSISFTDSLCLGLGGISVRGILQVWRSLFLPSILKIS